MAHVSQITIGTDTYWVYGDEAEFKTFMVGKVDSVAYDTASANEKKKAMVSAARWIDRELWDGEPTVSPQPLAFPRTGLTDCDGNDVASDAAPEDVIEASFELANILLGDAAAADASTQGTNVKSVGAGSAKVAFFRPGSQDGSGGSGGVFPTVAQKLLRCFMGGSGSPANTPVATGTARENQICEEDFTRNRGMA